MTAVAGIRIGGAGLTLARLRAAAAGPVQVTLTASARRAVARCHAAIGDILAGGEAVYGLNTGFGALAKPLGA